MTPREVRKLRGLLLHRKHVLQSTQESSQLARARTIGRCEGIDFALDVLDEIEAAKAHASEARKRRRVAP